MSDKILTPDQIQMAQEAEPAQILAAIHKRIVDTEKLMMGYRNHAKNLQVELEMIKERIEKLEKKIIRPITTNAVSPLCILII